MMAGSGASPVQVRFKSGISPGMLGKSLAVLFMFPVRNY